MMKIAATFTLTAEQQETYAALREDPTQQLDGMATWYVELHDGKRFPYLTNDCRDRASAFLGAVQRFHARVKNVHPRKL